ncbi:hypothetical protein BRC92_04330 [Halobacteriales archaeon QS_4_69_31]|jgi:hypothetical protein|nr:MAG: hypothetical protein BRC92_04330 [Halobacteriales archaeon QS_4_69_31]
MDRAIRLSELESELSSLSYPVSPDDVVDELGTTTLLLADGETTIGEVVSESNADRFDSADDLVAEVRSLLPREAVGEPHQSEGEG